MQTVMTTNNAYDSILLVDNTDQVIGAWSPASADDIFAYTNSGFQADYWEPNYPDENKISDYGVECGRDGVISDPARKQFWGV